LPPSAPLLRAPPGWGGRRDGAALSALAGSPTRLIASDDWKTPELMARAEGAIAGLIGRRIGGACFDPDPGPKALGLAASGLTLLVLPDRRDAHESSFARMVAHAKTYDPATVAAAPSSDGGARAGRWSEEFARAHGWRFVPPPVSPWTLLDAAARVLTLDDEAGFLALLRGREVRCFAPAFYAGWGATIDDPAISAHGARRTAPELFAAVCLAGTRYRDPFTGAATSFEAAADILAEWRRHNEANRKIAATIGISFWKRRRLRELLASTSGMPAHRRGAAAAVDLARRKNGAVAVWASREPPALAGLARAAGVPVVRVEDGFLRSLGLGADFIPPASIVADWHGMYFDPSRVSDLMQVLNDTRFDADLLVRARRLAGELVRRGITKYNTGARSAPVEAAWDRRRIFVPGQVADDRSVTLGGAGVDNRDLLARVRAANPDAFIIYKPHPDVEAGHRAGAVPDHAVRRFADLILRGVSSAAIIAAVDEIHTLTSLCGFEALLRGRAVTVYGKPFYAGWGLTTDLVAQPNRRRRLSLDELVAGTLILYPRYLDPVTRLPCGPEIVMDRFGDPGNWRTGTLVRLRRLQGRIALLYAAGGWRTRG